MLEWLQSVLLLAYETWGLLWHSMSMIALLLPMILLVELPLIIIVVSGLVYWFSQKAKRKQYYYPSVSCIITCYSEGRDIEKTIYSLCEQLYLGRIEIIPVVDGASQNKETWQAALDCAAVAKLRYPHRQVVLLPKWQRGGRVSTLNAGLYVASGELVINVDGDTSFDNNMVAKVSRHFIDPNVPALGGALRVRNTKASFWSRMQAIEYMISMQLGKTGMAQWNLINNVSGAFGAFRRQFLQHIGGWDTHTAEDLDLTVRMKAYFKRHPNFRIPFDPHAVGHTDVPVTLKELLMQRLRWDGDLLFLYLRKHKHSLSPALLGWKTFIFTLMYGVLQNILLPVLLLMFSYVLLISYPSMFVGAIFLNLYLIYLGFVIFSMILYLLAVSERVSEDLRIVPWLLLYPFYGVVLRTWSVVALCNEVFRRGHEESSMAPWWVLKRGQRY